MHFITAHDAPAIGLRGLGDHSWYDRGLCYGMDIEEADKIFFPTPRATKAIERAKAICAQCPVRVECLGSALDTNSITGIRAGLTEAERRPLHEKVAKRLEYRRVEAMFRGRDVPLSKTEREHVIRRAIQLGWSVHQLSQLLRTEYDYTRRKMREQEREMAKEQKAAAEAGGQALVEVEVAGKPGAQAPTAALGTAA